MNNFNEISTASGNLPTVSEEHSEAIRLHGAIVADAQAAAYHLISLGKNLREMNEKKLYKELGFESLGDYATAAVGLKGRAAYNYIAAYETYGEDGLAKYGSLGITKLTALIQLAPDDRAELLDGGAAEMSTRELQAAIDELKKKNEQLTFELSERDEADEKREEMLKKAEEYEAEIARLTALVEEERKNKILPAPQMSEAEKEEIRKQLEAETQARYSEEAKEMANEAARKAKAEYEQKAAAAEKKLKEAEEQVGKLSQKLKEEQANAEKLKVQANAQKPAYSSGKEAVKAHFGYIKKAVEDVAALLRQMDDKGEAEKLRTGMIQTLEACKGVLK